jgi:hypothetical protein
MWQHEETGRTGFVDVWQVENGWQIANPRLKLVRALTYVTDGVPESFDPNNGDCPHCGPARFCTRKECSTDGVQVPALRRLTKEEVQPLMCNDKQAMARAVQRKFCEVNGLTPPEGVSNITEASHDQK